MLFHQLVIALSLPQALITLAFNRIIVAVRDERRLLLCVPPATNRRRITLPGYKTCKMTRNSTIASIFNVSLC